ncbi:hypothetical protein DT23_13795 [Thioclava indica]|uniref:Uncharacterized protein n=1 Tax=Thioclava indica TaxID=1353528 RepID=A0A074KF83_9RHOB|nr:hypothetical protein DT23_13795 [Thioclava indica]
MASMQTFTNSLDFEHGLWQRQTMRFAIVPTGSDVNEMRYRLSSCLAVLIGISHGPAT